MRGSEGDFLSGLLGNNEEAKAAIRAGDFDAFYEAMKKGEVANTKASPEALRAMAEMYDERDFDAGDLIMRRTDMPKNANEGGVFPYSGFAIGEPALVLGHVSPDKGTRTVPYTSDTLIVMALIRGLYIRAGVDPVYFEKYVDPVSGEKG